LQPFGAIVHSNNRAAMTYRTLQYQVDDATGIARVTFDRPEVLNAINVELASEFLSVVRNLAQVEGLRCVVLGGAGKAFMAGGDVSLFAGGADKAATAINQLLDCLNPAILSLRALDAPILAGVQGVAAGAGLSLALMADVLVATDRARFMMAYDRIAAVPDCGGSWFLKQRVGVSRATELMMLSRELDAAEAKNWGMVTTTTPVESFNLELQQLARKLAVGPTRAYGQFRRLLERASCSSLAAQLEAERRAFLSIIKTRDFEEGVCAFLEKRPALFRGI
jgi:2-(1,2-epoxy-1,2-dihydrophenyl)acetyl-CoA isomerase